MMAQADSKIDNAREVEQEPIPQRQEIVIEDPVLRAVDVTIRYGETPAVKNISIDIARHHITAIIGPSGCGKSTFLRAFNRMNEFIPECNFDGELLFLDQNLYAKESDPAEVRRRIGMVFQKPNPFPKTIFKNIAWGPHIHGFRGNIDELVEDALRKAALWNEVKERLHTSAMGLSGGQQQRLCIARALAMQPEVILMDEPCSALDPVSTASIEDLMIELKKQYSIVIVTHNMQQASRVSDYTAFFDAGELVEYGETEQVFTLPHEKRTEEYVTGRFG